MESMKASGYEEDAPKYRVGQAIPELEVFKGLDPEKAKTTYEGEN